MSLREAIDHATSQSLPVKRAQAEVEGASARRRSALGHLGPKLSLEGNVMRWNEEVLFEMPPPSADVLAKHGEVVARYGDLMSAMPDLFSFGAIREKVTSQVSVTVAQPITPMVQLVKGYQAATLEQEASREDLRATRGSQALAATNAYVDLTRAMQTVAIAQEAVRQVEAHLDRARTFREVGLIGKNDVLKTEVALAEANERLITVRAGMAVAGTALALTLGFPPGQEIVPVEEFADPPPGFDASLESCVETARQKRPELTAMAKRVSQAKLARDIARWTLVPQVAAVAGYQHTEGQGLFMPENTYFVGGVLKWDFWEWGARYNATKDASAKARQVEIGAKQLSDAVYFEVERAFHELKAAAETLQVTRAAVANAEESLRIEQVRFEVQTSTSTDVLDAQLALTRTKLSHSAALYRSYVARAALLRAMGTITDRHDDGAGAGFKPAPTPARADGPNVLPVPTSRSEILESVQ